MIKNENSYYILAIYLILKKYANVDEPLTVREIAGHIQQLFQSTNKLDNRTIKVHLERIRTLSERLQLGDELMESVSAQPSYYFLEPIDEATLRLLADIIASSKYIDQASSKELIATLFTLNGKEMPKFYHNALKHKRLMMQPNREVFISVERIAEAVEQGRKIRCDYLKYNDKHELVSRGANGVRDVCVYELIWTSNYYYALCRFEDSGKVYFLRIDKMKDVELLEEVLPPLPPDFDRSAYVSTQPHLFGGQSQVISFEIDKYMLDQVVDSFGKAAKITELDRTYKISVISSVEMMHVWILQYSPYISNIYPEQLKRLVRMSLEKSLARIGGNTSAN